MLTDAERSYWQLYIRKRVAIDPVTGCWNWQQGCNKHGYGRLWGAALLKRGLSQLAHRLSYTVFIGPMPSGLLARHQCHNPPCCNPEHLLLGTQSDNVADGIRDGRPLGHTRLTATAVAEIKRLLSLRIYTQRQIGLMFGVGVTAINNIARGLRWAHIQPAATEVPHA